MIEASALSSAAKEHTYTSCANTHRHPWWNFICRRIRSRLRRIPECSCPSVHFAIDCMKRAWREWAPFSWRSCDRSWHDFADAKDQDPEPQLHKSFAVSSNANVFWSPSGTLCPKARGLSPQHIWEQAPCVFAAWPCFPCPPNCKMTPHHHTK